MSIDVTALRARVSADLPWHSEPSMRGTLRIADAALVLEKSDGAGRVTIPLAAIARTSVESTLGVLPSLHVWHSVAGRETCSRFDFIPDKEDDAQDSTEGWLADRMGTGLAGDAAKRLEGGLRALTGGLNQGKRVMRQAVDGMARQDEYRMWSTAITQAQREAARATPAASTPASPPITPPPSILPAGAVVPEGTATSVFGWFRDDALRWLRACGERAVSLAVPGIPVIQPHYPLDSQTCRIVVAGEFSRGKSTLINALFGIHGEIALPTGMTPTTPLACAIRVPRVGETDGATVSYRTARPPLQLTLEEFRAGVRLAEEGGEAARGRSPLALHLEEARRVEVRVTGAYLPAGVEIEDTPGLNEQSGRSAGAMAALGRADLILFVLAADQLLSDLEREVIDRLVRQGYHRNIVFLVNFWENIDDDAQRAILRQRVESILGAIPHPSEPPASAEVGMEPRHIHYISALQAARAQRQRKPAPEESGVPRLRYALREMLGPESSALLLRARVGRALRYIDLLAEAVSHAAAAAVLGDGETREARGKDTAFTAAEAAALGLLDGLDGAARGAMARRLALVRDKATPGLRRVTGLMAQANMPSTQDLGMAVIEARRTLASEMRAAAAECALAAQDAIDLVLAQCRAAFLARGLPAPVLEARVEPVALAVPLDAGMGELGHLLDSVAETLETAMRARVGQCHHTVVEELRAAVRNARPTTPPPATPGQSDRDLERLRRRAALQGLEDDLARLRQILLPCVDR